MLSEFPVGKPIPLAELEKELLKRGWGPSPFIESFRNLENKTLPHVVYDTFTSKMQSVTKGIGESVELDMKNAHGFEKAEYLLSKGKSALKLKPNELSIMEDGLHYLQNASGRYSDMMNNRGWFK